MSNNISNEDKMTNTGDIQHEIPPPPMHVVPPPPPPPMMSVPLPSPVRRLDAPVSRGIDLNALVMSRANLQHAEVNEPVEQDVNVPVTHYNYEIMKKASLFKAQKIDPEDIARVEELIDGLEEQWRNGFVYRRNFDGFVAGFQELERNAAFEYVIIPGNSRQFFPVFDIKMNITDYRSFERIDSLRDRIERGTLDFSQLVVMYQNVMELEIFVKAYLFDASKLPVERDPFLEIIRGMKISLIDKLIDLAYDHHAKIPRATSSFGQRFHAEKAFAIISKVVTFISGLENIEDRKLLLVRQPSKIYREILTEFHEALNHSGLVDSMTSKKAKNLAKLARSEDISRTIESGEIRLNESNEWTGKTELHTAIEEGNIDIVKALLDNGSNPNHQDKRGYTPFHLAYTLNKPEMVELLFEYSCDFNLCDARNSSPLHLACKSRDIELIKRLIRHGADPNISVNRRQTPLEQLAMKSDLPNSLPEYSFPKGGLNFDTFRRSGAFSDVTVLVDGREYKLHKMILTANSSVLAAACDPRWLKEGDTLEIGDTIHQAFDLFLEYLYTGSVSLSLDSNINLYVMELGYRYMVKNLSQYCQHVLTARLTPEEVIPMYEICESFTEARAILFYLANYILKNYTNISDPEHITLFKVLDLIQENRV